MAASGAISAHGRCGGGLPVPPIDMFPPFEPNDWYPMPPIEPPNHWLPPIEPPVHPPIDWFPMPPEMPVPPAHDHGLSTATVARRILEQADLNGDGKVTKADLHGKLDKSGMTGDRLQLTQRLLALAARGGAGARDGVVSLADIRGIANRHAGADHRFSTRELDVLLKHVRATGFAAMEIRSPFRNHLRADAKAAAGPAQQGAATATQPARQSTAQSTQRADGASGETTTQQQATVPA